ncbi:MAG: flippase-like domain-containing protein [Methanoregula sp.]|nr:MAG: flippase-like domain-containing protein [Methanoregula sp.]
MDRATWKWLLISVAFSIVVLAIVLLFTINDQTIYSLQKINPLFLALAFIAHLLTLCFWAWRVQMMSGSLGYRVGFFYSLNLVFANLLVAAVTPSQAGGEPVRIHELYKANVPLGDATAIVIMERVLDGIVLVILAAFAMLALNREWKSIGVTSGIIMYVTAIFITGCFVLFIVFATRPHILKSAMIRGARFFTKHWDSARFDEVAVRINQEVDNFHGALKKFVHSAKGGVLWGLLFTMLYWVSECVTASLILVGLGQPPLIFESFVINLILAILMMIPLTPGSSGIAEVGATSMYALFIPSSILGIFVVIWRLVLYYFNIALGIISSVLIVQREATAK